VCAFPAVRAGAEPALIRSNMEDHEAHLTHRAVLHGFTARFTTASAMLGNLDAQDGALAL